MDIGSSLQGFGSWIGDQISGFTGAGAVQAQKDANLQNLQLTHEQWAREDNAVERRAADMKAAGFNPLLAAGSPAQAGPAARMESTGAADPIGRFAGLALNAVKTLSEASKSQADANLASAQIPWVGPQAKSGIGLQGAEAGLKNAQTPWVAPQAKSAISLQGAEAAKAAAETTGLDIANEFRRSMNPLELSDMQVKVNLDKALAGPTLDKLNAEVKNLDQSRANMVIDQLATKAGIKLTELDQAMRIVSTRLESSKVGLTEQEIGIAQQEFSLKVIALKTAGLEQKILEAASKVDPGTAEGIGKWTKIIGNLFGSGGLTTILK